MQACDAWPSSHQVGRVSIALSCQAAATRDGASLLHLFARGNARPAEMSYLLLLLLHRPLSPWPLLVLASGERKKSYCSAIVQPVRGHHIYTWTRERPIAAAGTKGMPFTCGL